MKQFLALATLLMTAQLFAADLTINGAEVGIGKFHRKDNKVHRYDSNNVWKPYILPENAPTKEAFVQKNSNDNYTIFFTNLEEFLSKMVEISRKTGKKIGLINLNAHGMPGAMWFPKDAKTRDSSECSSWRDSANNSDDDNYDQYYSAVSKAEIQEIQAMGNAQRIPPFNCLTGLGEWTQVVARVPAIKETLTQDAQVHMLSCVVGLGALGDSYTQGLAKLLLSTKGGGQVQTAIKFGLGDWSMGEGMGFWGYESDSQLNRDNSRYSTHRRDSEMAQRGDIRVAIVSEGKVKSGMIQNQEYMLLEKDERDVKIMTGSQNRFKSFSLPSSVRIPGTKLRIQVR